MSFCEALTVDRQFGLYGRDNIGFSNWIITLKSCESNNLQIFLLKKKKRKKRTGIRLVPQTKVYV